MGKTFSEKALGRNVGREVSAGEIIQAKPDLCMSHDNSAAIAKTFAKLGVDRVKDPGKIAIVLDHCVPAANAKYAENHKAIRALVAEQGVSRFHDMGEGICHQVLPEKGHVVPGWLIVGSDSHTCTYGAFGAFATGIGRSEAAVVWATGEIWLKVPETMKITIKGRLGEWVTAKDVALKLIGERGADGGLYKALEFTGPVVDEMSISSRMVLCNMAVEFGAKNGYTPPDEKMIEWLKPRVDPQAWDAGEILYSDPDASYCEEIEIDMTGVGPQVACPHTVDNVKPVEEVAGTKVHQVFLGTCTNGRIEDFDLALRILRGRKVAAGTRLIVGPASREIYAEMIANGMMAAFIEAGAVVINPGCGPCLGAHEGVLADGEVCLSTMNRNFKGRMGNPNAEIYLASPAVAAATAVAGEIADPRSF
ncbi:MAG: 3-isopropylmalate dehydratase large subunit [Candidatus Methanospirare jalkutatii]|nr:3-isopropylmalate dehydratase large subunit [Candidatus Methanospirare jalkutatii]